MVAVPIEDQTFHRQPMTLGGERVARVLAATQELMATQPDVQLDYVRRKARVGKATLDTMFENARHLRLVAYDNAWAQYMGRFQWDLFTHPRLETARQLLASDTQRIWNSAEILGDVATTAFKFWQSDRTTLPGAGTWIPPFQAQFEQRQRAIARLCILEKENGTKKDGPVIWARSAQIADDVMSIAIGSYLNRAEDVDWRAQAVASINDAVDRRIGVEATIAPDASIADSMIPDFPNLLFGL